MRYLPFTFLLSVIVLITACGEADDEISDAQGPVSDSTPAATATQPPQSSDSPDPPIDASVERDPADVIRDIVIDPNDPDTELIYSMLPERYRVIEYADFWVESVSQSFPTTALIDESTDLMVNEYEGYSVVKWLEHPATRWVLSIENDQWRLDPGDFVLIYAALRAEYPHDAVTIGMGQDGSLELERTVDHDAIGTPLLSINPVATGSDSDGLRVVMEIHESPQRSLDGDGWIDGHLLQDTVIPLENMQWSTGDDSGPVEVTWTSAALSGDSLTIPGWTDEQMKHFESHVERSDQLPPRLFNATLLLSGVPEESEEVELTIDNVAVGPFGEDEPFSDDETIDHSFRYVIPNETTELILIGEAPELGDPPTEFEAPEAPDEDDLPPIPDLADLLEIDLIAYEQDGDAIDTQVRVVTDDVRIEPAWRTTLIWDDDTETDAEIEFDEDGLLLSGVREDGSLDDEVIEVRFEQILWLAGEDDEALIDESSIRTSLGEFAIVSVRENRINLLPLGPRYLRDLSIDDAGVMIRPSGAGASFDQDFRPYDLSMEFDQDVADVLSDEPLPARVEVWVAEPGVVLSFDE